MNAIISEFFDEAITHMLPGLVIIFLFGHQFIRQILLALNYSGFTFCLFLSLTAWLVGLTLDVASITAFFGSMSLLRQLHQKSLQRTRYHTFSHWLDKQISRSPFIRKILKHRAPTNTICRSFPDQPPEIQRHLEQGERLAKSIKDTDVRCQFLWRNYRQSFMLSAQKIMYRNLFLIFLPTSFPLFYPKPFASQPLSDIHWHWWCGLVATVTYFAAWQWTRSPLCLEEQSTCER